MKVRVTQIRGPFATYKVLTPLFLRALRLLRGAFQQVKSCFCAATPFVSIHETFFMSLFVCYEVRYISNSNACVHTDKGITNSAQPDVTQANNKREKVGCHVPRYVVAPLCMATIQLKRSKGTQSDGPGPSTYNVSRGKTQVTSRYDSNSYSQR